MWQHFYSLLEYKATSHLCLTDTALAAIRIVVCSPSLCLQLTCLGPLIHRLMVQATDDVYDRTKKLMKEAEEQRKEARYETKLVCFFIGHFRLFYLSRAQEIKLPSSKGTYMI